MHPAILDALAIPAPDGRCLPFELRALLASPFDPNAAFGMLHQQRGATPLEIALDCRHEPLALALLDLGANWRSIVLRPADAAHQAARFSGRVLERLAQGGISLDQLDERTSSQKPIHAAAESACLSAVSFLLSRGAAPGEPSPAPNGYDWTPLHWMARAGQESPEALACAQALAGAGADLAAYDHFSLTPAHWAFGEGCAALARALLALRGIANVSATERHSLAQAAAGGLADAEEDGREWPCGAAERGAPSGSRLLALLEALPAQLEKEEIELGLSLSGGPAARAPRL